MRISLIFTIWKLNNCDVISAIEKNSTIERNSCVASYSLRVFMFVQNCVFGCQTIVCENMKCPKTKSQ